jgi:hypothetical protein
MPPRRLRALSKTIPLQTHSHAANLPDRPPGSLVSRLAAVPLFRLRVLSWRAQPKFYLEAARSECTLARRRISTYRSRHR